MKHWLIWFHSPVFPRKNATKKARLKNIYLQLNLTGIPRGINVDSTSILPWYVKDQILTNLHIISTYFFDVISLVEKSKMFSRTFFYVISMVGKFMLFPRIFFDVISMVKNSTLIWRTFFDVIPYSKYPRYLYLLFSTKFWWAKIRRCFWQVEN